ncbi:hypothetical protein [Gordonia hydrophobica]|uniref:Carboxymuconolactone decarboxylase n=1 Tax=Gordonia hydrophobica TaxID=40516 RepID=A0ABZ2U734_9ACTN|nr:hypothetical protein [Gordonia hydrophobica]MBM7365353.1 hypothetical protein [Gordonia hydrophobica]
MAEFRLPEIPDASREILDRIVPPPHRPPLLYLAMAANSEVLRQYAEGPILGLRGLLYTGQISNADRELCILRVTGRLRAEHEWGVHVAYFGKTSGLTDSQVRATVTDEHPAPDWTARQRAIIAVADAIAGLRPLGEGDESLVAQELPDDERTEFIAIAAQYLAISAQCRLLSIPVEPGTPSLPDPPTGQCAPESTDTR